MRDYLCKYIAHGLCGVMSELTDVTASSARGQAKVMSLSSDLKQQPVSSGVTGSRTDTISYSSVVSGRNSNSPAAGATGPARPASTDNNACVTTARASPSNSNPRLTLAEKKDPDGAVLGPGADMTMRGRCVYSARVYMCSVR